MARRKNPRACTIGFANFCGAMPTDRHVVGNNMLRRMKHEVEEAGNGQGVIVGVEADDLDASEILGRDWWISHRAAKDMDGVLIAGTKERTLCRSAEWHPGAPSNPESGPRPILVDRISVDDEWSFTAAAMHMPKPKGSGNAPDIMAERARELDPDIIGSDMNLRRAAAQGVFHSRVLRGNQVVFLMSQPGRLHVSRAKLINVLPGTTFDDHPGIVVKVTPKKKP